MCYWGWRFGNVFYRYGQFSETYHTWCFYLGGNEVSSSNLTNTSGTPPNTNGTPTSTNYFAVSPGAGWLVGNNIFNAGIVTSLIHVLGVTSPMEYAYQDHLQLSIVIGVSLNGK